MGKHADKAVRIRQPGRGDAFIVSSIQLAVPDIIHHCTGEQVDILQYDAERLAQVFLVDIFDIDTVVQDSPAVNVVETVDQVRYSRLPCTCCPHKGDFLARLRIQ